MGQARFSVAEVGWDGTGTRTGTSASQSRSGDLARSVPYSFAAASTSRIRSSSGRVEKIW